jgi:hypothetical protein
MYSGILNHKDTKDTKNIKLLQSTSLYLSRALTLFDLFFISLCSLCLCGLKYLNILAHPLI